MFTAPSLPTKDQYEGLVRKQKENHERQRQEDRQRKIAPSLVDKEVSPPVRSMYQKEAAAKGSQKHGGKTENNFLKACISSKLLLTLYILSLTVFVSISISSVSGYPYQFLVCLRGDYFFTSAIIFLEFIRAD